MRTLLIAAVALCVSGAAFATDIKATVMTDSEMDKVTAGSADPTTQSGTITAQSVTDNVHASASGLANGIGTGNKP
jgi:hypothetical protein